MSSVGEGIGAIGQGLMALQEIWRTRAKEKINYLIDSNGGDFQAAASAAMTDPQYRKAWRMIYGADPDPNSMQKSIDQKLKEFKLADSQTQKEWMDKAHEYWMNKSGNPVEAMNFARESTAPAWAGNYNVASLPPDKQQEARETQMGMRVDAPTAWRALNQFMQISGQWPTQEHFAAVGQPYVPPPAGFGPPEGGAPAGPPQVNPAMQATQGIMENLPGLGPGLAAGMGQGLEALQQAAGSLFGGGQQPPQQPQQLLPGSKAQQNVNAAEMNAARMQDLDEKRGILERGLGIKQQNADTYARSVSDRSLYLASSLGLQRERLDQVFNDVNGLTPAEAAEFDRDMKSDQALLVESIQSMHSVLEDQASGKIFKPEPVDAAVARANKATEAYNNAARKKIEDLKKRRKQQTTQKPGQGAPAPGGQAAPAGKAAPATKRPRLSDLVNPNPQK